MGNSSGGYSPPSGDKKGKVEVIDNYHSLALIFILLHEFGHHIDFTQRGIVSEEEEAYQYYPTKSEEAPCPKEYANKIRQTERKAVKYGREIAVCLDLKLPEFSYLKDDIISELMLDAYLKKGFTTKEDRYKIRRIAKKKTRAILNDRKKKSSRRNK